MSTLRTASCPQHQQLSHLLAPLPRPKCKKEQPNVPVWLANVANSYPCIYIVFSSQTAGPSPSIKTWCQKYNTFVVFTQVDFYFEVDLSQEMQCVRLGPLTFIRNASTDGNNNSFSLNHVNRCARHRLLQLALWTFSMLKVKDDSCYSAAGATAALSRSPPATNSGIFPS